MIQELVDTFEELKKYDYLIDMGDKGFIIIKFKNEHFYHLAGFHKLNLDIYFPQKCISKDKKYKYIKSHTEKFENILKNQIKENQLLKQRITTFKYIPSIFDEKHTILYNLREKNNPMSLYDGDFGLMRVFQIESNANNMEDIYCLLGLKNRGLLETTYNCVPQSWMADRRPNSLVQYKKPLYIKMLAKLPLKITQHSENEDI